MTTKIFKSVSDVYFTDAPYDEGTFAQVTEIYSAKLVINVSTVDDTATVTSVEEVVQPTDGAPGYVVITTTITTSDLNMVADTNPAVSDVIVNIATEGSETVNDDGKTVTTLVSTVTIQNKLLPVYGGSVVEVSDASQPVQFRYIVLKNSLINPYLHGSVGGDDSMLCQDMYTIMNITCAKLSEGLYQTLKQNWANEKIIELDADTAFYGTTFFSEIRQIAKLWEAKTPWYGEKVPTEITPQIVLYILKVMKTFAIEIINSEYERRFVTMRNASMLEAESWNIQKHEAKEWLTYGGADGHVTPFLDYMSTQRSMDKTLLANKILEKAEIYNDNLSKLLVEMQLLIKKFENCDNVKEINVLYEDCFGIAMPISQAVEYGRTISDTDFNRKPEWSVKGNGYYF